MLEPASDADLRAAGVEPPDGDPFRVDGFFDFVRWLQTKGASTDEIAAAARRGWGDLDALRLELLVFGPGELDLADLAELARTNQDHIDKWWNTLGLAHVQSNGRSFNDTDVAIARFSSGMTSTFGDRAEDVMRVAGLALRQLATAWLDTSRVTAQTPLMTMPDVEVGRIVEAWVETKPDVDQFLTAIFWRHMCDVLAQHSVTYAGDGTTTISRTIVFVDLVDYTSLSQRIDHLELGRIVGALERLAVSAASAQHGRVVKTLGDGVMLEFGEASAAVHAAQTLVEPRPDLPLRRAGVASGHVLARQGDYFGPAVNLTARLAAVAEPGEVVVDHLPAGIAGDEMAPVVLKGYDEPVTPFRVHRPK
ncbi:MAG: adenylate cyclase [Actinomycetota bacterium]|jgi:class 3 adenylate cyclase